MPIEKCVGRIVEMIYLDRKGNMTKRQVRVQSVRDGRIKGFDLGKKSFRIFEIERVLAAMPVSRRVG